MKKLFSALLAGVLVAASAISVSASSAHAGGLYEFDSSDSEYWSADLSMLDKTAPAIWFEDGTAMGYNDPSYTDGTGAVLIDTLTSGWYEVVLCGLGTNAEDFPADVKGKVAFAVRGDSTFTVKSENAMNAGAIACLVGNNCRDEESVDEDGIVSSGSYSNINMSVEYYTIPMCSLASDCTVRLVAATADIAISDAVDAVRAVFGGELSLGLEAKNSAWVYIGTEEEYKANTTRTDANTVTGDNAVAAAPTAERVEVSYPASGAEVPEGSALIEGELIGAENGWDGTATSGRASAFDGNVNTYFDPATASVDYCGIDAGEKMILTKIVIRPRNDYADRFNGATIEAANEEDFSDAVTLFTSVAAADAADFIDVTDEIETADNTGYRYFRYINYTSHGDVAEVELYGYAAEATATVEETPAEVEETATEEVAVEETPATTEETVVEEAPAEEEETVEVEAPAEEATEETVEEAPQTFDFGVIAAVAAIVSAAGYAISKKR